MNAVFSVFFAVFSVLVHLFWLVDSADAWTTHRNNDHQHGAAAPKHAWCASAGPRARWRNGACDVANNWLPPHGHRENVRTETLAAGHRSEERRVGKERRFG